MRATKSRVKPPAEGGSVSVACRSIRTARHTPCQRRPPPFLVPAGYQETRNALAPGALQRTTRVNDQELLAELRRRGEIRQHRGAVRSLACGRRDRARIAACAHEDA